MVAAVVVVYLFFLLVDTLDKLLIMVASAFKLVADPASHVPVMCRLFAQIKGRLSRAAACVVFECIAKRLEELKPVVCGWDVLML